MNNRMIEVRSNIAGDIMKIRKGVVYKDSATVIDELMQNCQRAKANKVKIKVTDDTLYMRDDGVGCEDPQNLFEKNTSAWENEDEAFGEGFFSVFLLADKIRVRSHDWELKVDVLEMIETQNMDIEVKHGLDFQEGFEVELVGKKIEEEAWALRREVKLIAPVMAMQVNLNYSDIEQEELIEKKSDSDVLIDNEIFEAVLRPETGYSVVDYYYEDRPVRDDYKNGVSGRVSIKKGMITLKAPDRKEFIYDDKRRAMSDLLDEEIKNMYKEFIKTATDEELDEFEIPITDYLEVEEYAQILSISDKLFVSELVRDTEEETEHVVPKWEDHTNILQILEDSRAEMEEFKDTVEEERSKRKVGMLEKLLSKKKEIVYVPTGSSETYEKEIRRAEYMGISVMYARNRLYERAFEFYGVSSINTLNDLVKEEHIIDKDEPRTRKEERFLALMKRVEEHYDMKENSIRLADLDKVMKFSETGEVLERDGEEIHGLCNMRDGIIYINRSIVKFPEYRAQVPEYPTVTAHDYRVLLRVSQVLAHELAHLLYGFADNTIEHSQAMNKIGYELAELF